MSSKATNAPKITIDMTVADLQRIGYAQEGMGLGDLVNVILQPLGIMQQAQVVQLDEDLLYPENTRPVIGDYRSNIIYKDVQINNTAQVGAQIGQNAPGLLQGFIDTAVIGIMSSKTNRYTLPDGSEVYETDDGTKAVRFSGAGILLANGKTSSGDWNWRTAITGQGIVADLITSGVLNSNLIQILGTNGIGAVIIDENGIQVATSKDSSGNWIYTTAINGAGVNANTITSGVLNSNLIQILGSNGIGAVSIDENGIRIATAKDSSGQWIYTTAINGAGVNANTITSGTINANLIQLLGTGTYFDGTTLRIQHPTLGTNIYTEIDANGMRMISNGQVVGGLYKNSSGQVVTASGTLFNPASPVFQAYVGSQTSVGLEGTGIAMNYNGQYGGNIGVFTQEETPGAPPAGAAFVTPGRLVLDGQNIQILSNDGGGITITSDAGMTFTFQGVNKAGQQMTLYFTAQDIWNAVITD